MKTLSSTQIDQLWGNVNRVWGRDSTHANAIGRYFVPYCRTLEVPDHVDLFVMGHQVEQHILPGYRRSGVLWSTVQQAMLEDLPGWEVNVESLLIQQMARDLSGMVREECYGGATPGFVGYSLGLYLPPFIPQVVKPRPSGRGYKT